MERREFLRAMALAIAAGASPALIADGRAGKKTKTIIPDKSPSNFYELPAFGNVSLMHITDVHAQLNPVYFREPGFNMGVGNSFGKAPHLTGEYLLKYFNIKPGGRRAHAFSCLDYAASAKKFGKMGGFAHLMTLVKNLRQQRPGALLLDGGDNWQGSATSLWTKGQDMVDASLLLGVDVMTGHWEFTYGEKRVLEIIKNDLAGKMDFLAQNIVGGDFEERVFKPYVIKEINTIPVAIIGQAFPYTPIANPKYLIPKWRFGIREESLQQAVDEVRSKGAQAVVLLSHNGMDVDLKLASRVTGIDAILGGHTHDAMPAPTIVKNRSGKTLVANSGAYGKFLSVLDFKVSQKRVTDFRYHLLPVFSNLIAADKKMSEHISNARKPYLGKLNEKLATTEGLLYRRGNFNGSFDQIILDSLIKKLDAEIAFSPGFRWGATLLPGDSITFEDVMTQTAITYPMVTLNKLSGAFIKTILEDVADNLFHHDPYYQQGGDMVRVGGLTYSINPKNKIGSRINDMRLNGKLISASKKYRVAGWASINKQVSGAPIWDVVANHLRDIKTVKVKPLNIPELKQIKSNPGITKNCK